ncbi:MAG: hypothetical protein NC180_02980 [Muribaculaceae bacterium]|nr:hypothetical protein [Roseburia sp.]MCM1430104.1 hypothetical protein [Muribaculaceae bacterium]MCM1492169.1 hypothetical protein [Muribaculaceae bacterium]
MKKRINMALGFICYALGVLTALYVGLWKMVCLPLQALYMAFTGGEMTLSLIIACGVKILFSTTLMGLIWCIGYIGYNHFKGTEDPDWDAIEKKRSCRDSEST